MSRHNDLQKPAHRLNNHPDDPPVRKVTIQQKVVQPRNTSAHFTDNSDSFRRYPNVVSHDPSSRGNRGKNWAKPSRGVVANIVKDLDRGVIPNNVNNNEYAERKTRNDPVKTRTSFYDISQKTQAVKRDKDIAFKPEEKVAQTSPRSGETSTTSSIENIAQHSSHSKTSGYVETTTENDTSKLETKAKSPIVPPKPKRTNLGTKVEKAVTNPRKISMETELKKVQSQERIPEQKHDGSLTKSSEMKTEQEQNYVGKTSESAMTRNTKKAPVERRISDGPSFVEKKGLWENALEELKEKISERKEPRNDSKKPRPFKHEEETPLEVETSVKTTSDIPQDNSRTLQAHNRADFLSENVVRSEKFPSSSDFRDEQQSDRKQTERRSSNSPSWVQERQLWEKAFAELELVISDKNLVIDNLSRVNRKLSEDIEHYEDILRDLKGRDGTNDATRPGNTEQYHRIIDERDKKIRELEDRISGDRESYQRIIEQREAQIGKLESKLYEMRQNEQTKSKDPFELSHGSQNVLKTLELKREKVALEKKVEELQERLKNCESLSRNAKNLQAENTGRKLFQEIPSLLYKFQNDIEMKLNENAQVVSSLEEKLEKCVEDFQILTKLSKNKTTTKRAPEDEILKESTQQVQCVPDLNNFQTQISAFPGDSTLRDSTLRVSTLRDSTLGDSTTRDETSITSAQANSNSAEVDTYIENLKNLEAELEKEKLINDDIMERFVQLEELNSNYLYSIASLESRGKDIDGLRVENEDLREQNKRLLSEITELRETREQDSNGLQTKDDNNLISYKQQASSLQTALNSQESEVRKLREKLVEDEALIEELQEKIVEDEELIEEIRANCQREEKWNREMQRNYEWELNSSAKKDDRIEEFQDCLWAREKLVQELQQQLDFEDKRCEELLEKLIVSQKEVEEFEEMRKDFKKKLEDSEKRIKEFCDQNDRDAITISNLTSENKQLRLEVDGLTKMRKHLEEDLERANGCLEAVEADKENFLIRQESEVKELSDKLEDTEFTNKDKDEVIEKLQENVVQLSADVQEMEFKLEEDKLTLEEDLKKAREDVVDRDKNLAEVLEKYNEIQEVCKCLRETISEKEGEILEREAAMANQRETIEGLEKEVEDFRKICGDNSTTLNDKPELVYTESEMEEVTDVLEQERTLSEILRKQILFLENEIEQVKKSCEDNRKTLEEKDRLITEAQNEMTEREDLLEKTKGELNNANTQFLNTREKLDTVNEELSKVKDQLSSKEKELDENKTSTALLQIDLTELNIKYNLLEAIKDNTENELTIAKEKLGKSYVDLEGLRSEREDFQTRLDFNTRVQEENESMKQTIEDLKQEVTELRRNLNNANEQTQTNKQLLKSEVRALENDLEELYNECLTKESEIDGPIQLEYQYELQALEHEPIETNEDQHIIRVHALEAGVEQETDKSMQISWPNETSIDKGIRQQVDNKLLNEKYILQTEVNQLKQEFKQTLDKNNALTFSLNELETFNETVTLKNKDLQQKVEKLTEKWLRSDEKLRQAQITNMNLRYTLDEYISQSQNQIRHLKNHEREVATLTEHIHEMDVLVQGFKTALLEAVENENKEQKCIKNNPNMQAKTNLKLNGTKSEPCITPNAANNTRRSISTAKPLDQIVTNHRGFKESEITATHTGLCTTQTTENNSEKTFSFSNSSDVITQTDNKSTTQPAATEPLHQTDPIQNNVSNNESRFEFINTFHQQILGLKIPKNVILILIFSILVFCLGCTNNSIISRKYLFVFANSFITLIFFALWANERHKNKKYKVMGLLFGENVECENCGSKITIKNEEFLRHAKIKSSFQELHEKFLEAVETSSKDTLPIQELYDKYEKLKDEVDVMRKERLEKNITTTVSEIDEDSKNDRLLPENWNKTVTILGKAVVITLLCEVLYIRGVYFLPDAVNLVSFLLSLITISYFYETIYVETTTSQKSCTTSREMNLEQEIDELNHIIEKEHELVTTQREAIKVLEKRLRKEFEKRIKQRNVLLKKLKYKGKLEDLREVLDNDEQEDDTKNNNSKRHVNANITPPVERKDHRSGDTDINSNNQIPVVEKNAVQGDNGVNKLQLRSLNVDTHLDDDEQAMLDETHEGQEKINGKHDITKNLQEIIGQAEKPSLGFEFVFSPIFFFLGLPLTGILLLCRYITVPILMMVVQGALILKETKVINLESLPEVTKKNINPIVMDTIVVLYTCVLAVFLQCTQSIVILVTCAIVQLSVHWWTSYRLAKKEDVLQEITFNCLPSSTKQN